MTTKSRILRTRPNSVQGISNVRICPTCGKMPPRVGRQPQHRIPSRAFMFDRLDAALPDPILGLEEAYKHDLTPRRSDLAWAYLWTPTAALRSSASSDAPRRSSCAMRPASAVRASTSRFGIQCGRAAGHQSAHAARHRWAAGGCICQAKREPLLTFGLYLDISKRGSPAIRVKPLRWYGPGRLREAVQKQTIPK